MAQPARTPVNASPAPSRVPAHDSGPSWIATPSMSGVLIPFLLPVYPGAPHVHCASFGQAGVQLYPGSITTPTPQAFSVASSPSARPGSGVDPHPRGRSRTAFRPVSARLDPEAPLRGFNHWFTRVTPSDLASRTRAVWQYRPVPTLSRLLPALPGDPRIRLPPASPGRCDDPAAEPFHLRTNTQRLVAHPAADATPGPTGPAGTSRCPPRYPHGPAPPPRPAAQSLPARQPTPREHPVHLRYRPPHRNGRPPLPAQGGTAASPGPAHLPYPPRPAPHAAAGHLRPRQAGR